MFTQLTSALATMLRPLDAALTTPGGLDGLFASAGWVAADAITDEAVDALADALGIGDDLETLLEAGSDPTHAEAIDAVAAGARILGRLAELAGGDADDWAALLADVVDALPEPFDDTDRLLAALGDVADALVSQWLATALPAARAILRAAGVSTGTVPERVDWSAFGDLLSAPGDLLTATYGSAASLRTDAIDAAVRAAADLSTLPLRVTDVDPVIAERYWGVGVSPPAEVRQYGVTIIDAAGADARVDAVVVPVPDGPGADPWPTGIYIGPVATAGATLPVELGGGWSVAVTAGADLTGIAGLVLRRDAGGGVTVEFEQEDPELDVEVAFEAGNLVWTLGDPASTRLDVNGLAVGLGIRDGDDGFEPFASLAPLDGISVTIAPPAVGGFLRFLLGGGLTVDVDADIDISPSGLRCGGSLGIAFSVSLNKAIGPLVLDRLDLALEAGADGADVAARLAASMEIGPVSLRLDGLGVALRLTVDPEGNGTLGSLDIGLALLTPTRLVVGIESDVLNGGGFVDIDTDSGRYAGGLAVDLLGVGISALVAVDTVIPGDPDAWALFASLGATFPVPIPLGFGFTLNGVGGVLALDRAMDGEALALGLRTGAADSIMFPDDALGDSLELLDHLDEYFPLRHGNTVIGPVVMVGWGAPVTLITGQLGVLVSLPEGEIAVIGSLEALLPVPEAPLLTLHMDTLGIIDLAAGTFSVTASLYDSHLLDTIDLGGDMAMYLRATSEPYFLLSAGGYHPGFQPPSTVPAVMHDLRRMSASIVIDPDVYIAIESYFAVTSNSVQFGASVALEASVEIWPTTFTARGGFGFDVLLIFSPFRIVADMYASAAILVGGKELFAVDLAAHVEGPDPWFASGYASFRFLGKEIQFELEVGSKAGGEPKPIAHPLIDVLAALRLPEAWDEVAPVDMPAAGITFVTPAADEGERWIRPDHRLRARQSVAPFGRTMAIVGQAVPAADEELLTVTAAGLDVTVGPEDYTLATDWFAPAQFEVLGRAEKLSRASFELMDAGVTFGGAVAVVTSRPDDFATSVEAVYEDDLFVDGDSLADSLRSGMVAMSTRTLTATSAPVFAVAPTAWTAVRELDGTVAANVLDDAGVPLEGASQYDVMQAAAGHGNVMVVAATGAMT